MSAVEAGLHERAHDHGGTTIRHGARARSARALPGFSLAFGYTILYLSLLVLLPLGALLLKTARLTWAEFWQTIADPIVVAAYELTFTATFAATVVNSVAGTVIAWVLVRYSFPGRRIFDAIVDFPFALPTAVAGLTFSNLYLPTGWLGRWGFPYSNTNVGVVIVLIFVG